MSEASLLGELISTATLIAKELDVAESGYRVVMNCNADVQGQKLRTTTLCQ